MNELTSIKLSVNINGFRTQMRVNLCITIDEQCAITPALTAIEETMSQINRFYQRVHASFVRQGLMRSLGIQLGQVSEGKCEVILPHSDKITNQHGGFHGGAIGTIADIAAGYACLTLAPEHMEVVTVEYKINIMKAFKGGTLIAVGQCLKPGKRAMVSTAEVFHVDDGSHSTRKLCAIMVQTIMPVEKDGEKPSNTRDVDIPYR